MALVPSCKHFDLRGHSVFSTEGSFGLLPAMHGEVGRWENDVATADCKLPGGKQDSNVAANLLRAAVLQPEDQN